MGEDTPRNVTQEIPDNDIYSPMWDVHPVVLTDAAFEAGLPRQLRDHEEIADLFRHGVLVSAGFSVGPPNPSIEGLRAAPVRVNRPEILPRLASPGLQYAA